MDHNNLLQLRYFKLHLTIPINRCSHLPKSSIMFYLSKNEIPLEINGVRIPPNKSATVLLRRLRSAKATGESEIVFVSMDHICIGHGLSLEVCIHGEKALKVGFQQGVRWGTRERGNQTYDGDQDICSDRSKISNKRFYPKLTSILEEDNEEEEDDEEEDVKQVMKASSAKKMGKEI